VRVSFNADTVQKAARRGSPDPAAFGPQVSNRRRKPRRWETFGQTCVRGRETRAQLASADRATLLIERYCLERHTRYMSSCD